MHARLDAARGGGWRSSAFGMRFPGDILFVARGGRVVKVRRAVPRRRRAAAWVAFAVVELAAGALEGSGTVAGDALKLDV
jgi:uncharacterized membrane protein (UPF0127 family)